MQIRKKLLKKKWDLSPSKNHLYFYYTSAIKAMADRKFRRQCKQNLIKIWAMPSAFRMNTLFYAQGPCVGAVSATQISYDSYKSLTQTKSLSIFEKNRAYNASFLKELDRTKKAQDFCYGLCLCLYHTNTV